MTETITNPVRDPSTEVAEHAAALALVGYNKAAQDGEMSTEVHAKVGEYFDKRITLSQTARSAGAGQELQQYKDTFTTMALEVFGPQAANEKHGVNPRLSELVGILASVDNNAGVYYGKEDVTGIFKAVAHRLFDDPEAKQQLAEEEADVKKVVNARASAVTSLSREASLPLVKDPSGEWRVADDREYGATADFAPLEVGRQDASDKAGFAKYRFRQPTYTRTPDALHKKQIGEGWYTSEWHQDPNYWSAQLRKNIADIAGKVNAELAPAGASAVLVTEGGIFKGTSTEGTDVDTECWVTCNTAADFPKLYEGLKARLTEGLDAVPFAIKRGPGSEIGIRFVDRSTNQRYQRNKANGEFSPSDDGTIVDGNAIIPIRNHEKGLMLATADGVRLFRKPYGDEKDMYVSVGPDGSVQETTQPIAPSRKRDIYVDDSDSGVV